MKTFKIIDCTLTEGHQNDFCNFTFEDKLDFLILLDSFGIEYVEINIDDDRFEDLVKLKIDKGLKIKILSCTLPNISKDSLDIFEKCRNYKVDAIKLNYSDKIIDVCKYIKQNYSNMEIVLSINDFECIYLSNFEKLVDRVRIVDTLGIITHYEIEEVFDLIQDSTTFDLPIEYQFRNDTSSAVYNSYTALSNGCSHIAISVLGIGKRNGITDLSGFISRIYANDKQLLKRYDLPVLKHLDEFVAKRLGIHIPINNPITGICSWEQNIVYDEDFNTNIIFTQDIKLFKKMMQHIMPNVYEKLTDDYIRKLYIQINDDTSKDTTLYIKLNSDIDYARDYICKYIS